MTISKRILYKACRRCGRKLTKYETMVQGYGECCMKKELNIAYKQLTLFETLGREKSL